MPCRCFRRITIAFALHACVGLWGVPGEAADSQQLQSARQQFAQAEADEDANRWSDALEKFRRILDIKRTAGIQYHVALCEEHLGQLVSALADYHTADGAAHLENAQDVLNLVGKKLADLDARIPRLTVHLVPEVPDAGVTLDGALLDHSLLGVAMPVDPGVHRVDASAQDRTTSSVEVTMHERDATVLDVKLERAQVPGPAVAQDSSSTQGRTQENSNRRVAVTYTVTSLALAGGGLGAYIAAGTSRSSGIRECSQMVSLAADACESQREAVRAWDWVAAGAWAGAAAAATLAVLSWTRSSHSASVAPSVQIQVGLRSLGVGGDF
jgi:tetratricopeptide (TPR) repeat protein